jgi:hypothetical protein
MLPRVPLIDFPHAHVGQHAVSEVHGSPGYACHTSISNSRALHSFQIGPLFIPYFEFTSSDHQHLQTEGKTT